MRRNSELEARYDYNNELGRTANRAKSFRISESVLSYVSTRSGGGGAASNASKYM